MLRFTDHRVSHNTSPLVPTPFRARPFLGAAEPHLKVGQVRRVGALAAVLVDATGLEQLQLHVVLVQRQSGGVGQEDERQDKAQRIQRPVHVESGADVTDGLGLEGGSGHQRAGLAPKRRQTGACRPQHRRIQFRRDDVGGHVRTHLREEAGHDVEEQQRPRRVVPQLVVRTAHDEEQHALPAEAEHLQAHAAAPLAVHHKGRDVVTDQRHRVLQQDVAVDDDQVAVRHQLAEDRTREQAVAVERHVIDEPAQAGGDQTRPVVAERVVVVVAQTLHLRHTLLGIMLVAAALGADIHLVLAHDEDAIRQNANDHARRDNVVRAPHPVQRLRRVTGAVVGEARLRRVLLGDGKLDQQQDAANFHAKALHGERQTKRLTAAGGTSTLVGAALLAHQRIGKV
eukprot:ctg_345.g99